MNPGEATSTRTATWLAWTTCVVSLVITALSLLLLALNLSHPDINIYGRGVESTLFAVGFSVVGAVIVSRRPSDNSIGWLFCVVGFLFGVIHFNGEYAIYALLAAPGSLPGGEVAAWIASWLWVPILGLVVFLGLLFPDSRLPGRGWRWFAWLSVLVGLVGVVLAAFSPGPIEVGLEPIHNPLGVEGLPNAYEPLEALMFALVFVASASLLVRMRRVGEKERQQIKWFAYAAAITISGGILTYTVSETLGLRWLGWVGFLLLTVGALGLPVAMGTAILRYRLYEIDLIINRTLVYGLLTVTLGLVYFGSVLISNQLFVAFVGQGPQLVTVASTLVIAALFNPLRRRFQEFIDRRLYRRKYDAAKTLEAFGVRLREETDLKRISEDLVSVVRETMQPTHVSLWLCPVEYSKEVRGERAVKYKVSS